MGKKIALVFVLFSFLNSNAQELKRAGLLKTYLTISPGFMLDNASQPFYFHANLEGYLNEHISLAGDGYFYLGELNDNQSFQYHNSVFAGFNWHPLKDGSSDLFFGVQPGLTFTMLDAQSSSDNIGINPVASINIGYNYYMNEYFHFFVLGKTIFGQHSTYAFQSLNEIRLSAGLGFGLPLKR